MGKDLIDFNIDISGLKFQNPVVVLSGCMEYDEELDYLMPLNQLAAFITKTITLDERAGNPMPRTCEVTSGLINSIGLQNKGLYYYLREVLPVLKNKIDLPIVTSIAGFTIKEYASIASLLDKEENISAIEANISCPNLEKGVDGNSIFAQDEYMSYGVVKAIKESTSKPVIVKISPEVTDIRAIAQAVVDAGCDAVTVANTYPAMAVDIKTRKSKLGSVSGGLSG
ncbi:MAG: dihydroorotate dehydrogenase, partial [Candidatus Saelkia tenebricola]|nr:dihydroorotate dehydrogenase [Candidatus Saelkia tenebricola]